MQCILRSLCSKSFNAPLDYAFKIIRREVTDARRGAFNTLEGKVANLRTNCPKKKERTFAYPRQDPLRASFNCEPVFFFHPANSGTCYCPKSHIFRGIASDTLSALFLFYRETRVRVNFYVDLFSVRMALINPSLFKSRVADDENWFSLSLSPFRTPSMSYPGSGNVSDWTCEGGEGRRRILLESRPSHTLLYGDQWENVFFFLQFIVELENSGRFILFNPLSPCPTI